ncbi:hypothetical protein [Mesobacillus maritimus]|uniref:Uncharacterized protein n=1 Tax=Mesobacillus maritimus TaxID=1643336 RepID=A0ABS7K8W8_9BACI|nr:hypothetical protein [Mesobacillus maritimus]MBY0098713.1 hypothetical protein [Mesobacillus maritimus]
MVQHNDIEVRLLRFSAPALYQEMVDIFSKVNLHPYDLHATTVKTEEGFEVTIQFSSSFTQSVTTFVSFEQASKPDEETAIFFTETADKCKQQLIADYFNRIKV